MNSDQLENLVRMGTLDRIPRSKVEFDNLVFRGKSLHRDSLNTDLSIQSRFSLAYGASHSFSTAALRWHGYKASENRFTAFQTVTHTLDLNDAVPVLSEAHRRRGNVEYDADPFDDEPFLDALIEVNKRLASKIDELEPI